MKLIIIKKIKVNIRGNKREVLCSDEISSGEPFFENMTKPNVSIMCVSKHDFFWANHVMQQAGNFQHRANKNKTIAKKVFLLKIQT